MFCVSATVSVDKGSSAAAAHNFVAVRPREGGAAHARVLILSISAHTTILARGGGSRRRRLGRRCCSVAANGRFALLPQSRLARAR